MELIRSLIEAGLLDTTMRDDRDYVEGEGECR